MPCTWWAYYRSHTLLQPGSKSLSERRSGEFLCFEQPQPKVTKKYVKYYAGLEIRRASASVTCTETREEHFNESLLKLASNI